MAEFSHQSLYMHKAIEQVSSDDRTVAAKEPSLSLDLKAINTFGREFRLMCAVCLQDLKQPKQLKSCYHIFCKDCLQPFMEKATGGNVTCPYCGMSCLVEDISNALSGAACLNGFQGQISNYVESNDVSCNNDGHETSVLASFFCLECGQNFCDTCQSSHSAREDFKHHIVLRLFKTRSTMTVGIHRSSEFVDAASVDQQAVCPSYKCPICRNTDRCVHEGWLKDLLDEKFSRNELCPIPEHASGNKLIAYCPEPGCDDPICRNCSMVQHKVHQTIDIGDAVRDKLPELKSVKKMLTFQEEMFKDAAEACEKAETDFQKHILEVEQKIIDRKGSMHAQVGDGFNVAFSLIEQTGRKQVELNRQSEEMHQERQFLQTAISLAEKALEKGANPLEVVRVWKGLKLIVEDLRGQAGKEKTSRGPEVVMPQVIVEKRLVLPAPSCMSPDLGILQKVGVESTVLRQAFYLQAEPELLLFYSILPLTQTEALLSCKPCDGTTEVVQYSSALTQRCSVSVAEGGETCLAAVLGRGIILTLYQAPSGSSGGSRGACCSAKECKNQVLFWNEALGVNMTELQVHRARDKLTVIVTTDLPPRGVAVTRDNHLVVVTATDPHHTADQEPAGSRILLMTLQGDLVRHRSFTGSSPGVLNCPRYVTVNINDDICVTDEKDQAVIILNRRLDIKHRFINPYYREDLNRRFSPRGICHDSFGRLIVADPDNNAVLCIEYDDAKGEPLFRVILKNNLDGVQDLDSPKLVAMSPGVVDHGPRLWVVCRSNIQVFDYMDKE